VNKQETTMETVSNSRNRLAVAFAVAALGAACGPVAAQESAIAGIWRAQEGTPSGTVPGVTSSDIQTLFLSPNGQYRREIIVEGGDGQTGAAGKIIDSGEYRFMLPNILQYRRRSWVICGFAGCVPGQPIGANYGTLPFQLTGQGQAIFLQLGWTKIQ
jgi:hypothetical protein